MRRTLFMVTVVVGCSQLFTSCARSNSQVWEDSKTCSRYVGKGVRSLFGHHIDPRRRAASHYDWDWEEEGTTASDYIPLQGTEENSLAFSDYPVSRESPGDPGSAIPGIERFQTPTGHLATLFQNIHFETDNYGIKGEENLKTLHQIATYLIQHPHLYIFVEGHADERGTSAYNLALGSKRAHAIRNFLIENGVNQDHLFTVTYGKERPLAQGQGESVWKANRRGQFKLYER